MFGFPPNWETYAENYFEGEAFDSASAAGNISDTDNLLCKSKSKCILMTFQTTLPLGQSDTSIFAGHIVKHNT